MPPDPGPSHSDTALPDLTISQLQATQTALSTFRRIAVFTCFLTYLLVFIGGLVRVSGAGLGCPDWPTCYGRWIPPLSLADIPSDVDAGHFNIVLAWIEYLNRFAGIFTGLCIAVTAVFSFRLRRYPRIFFPALCSLPLVMLLGWQGKDVVSSSLQPVIVTIHFITAILLVALLTFIAQEAWYEESARPGAWRSYPLKAKRWIALLAFGAASQILFGTIVRSGLDTLSTTYPLLSSLERYGMLSSWRDLHFWSGLFIAITSIVAVVMLFRLLRTPSLFVRVPMLLIVASVSLEILFGVTMSVVGPRPLLQLYHLWVATLLVGALTILYSALARERDAAPSHGSTGAYRRSVLQLGFAVMGMTTIASAVIHSAEQSRTGLTVYSVLPPFAGRDQNDQPVTETLLDGKISVVACMFTSCRSVCPVMAVEVKKMIAAMNYSDAVQVISFTVDPAQDTPAVMKHYLDSLALSYGKMRWEFVNLGVDSIRTYCRTGLLVSDDLPGMHSAKFMLVDDHSQLRGYYDHASAADMDRLRMDIAALASRLPRNARQR